MHRIKLAGKTPGQSQINDTTLATTAPRNPVQMKIARWVLPVIALAAALAITTDAQASGPPGNCWNQALRGNPVHCHALEEAQHKGLITVSGIFRDGDVIFIFLAEEQVPDIQDFLREKGREFVTKNSVDKPRRLGDKPYYEKCPGKGQQELTCIAEDWTFWKTKMTPWDAEHKVFYLIAGGSEARKLEYNWRSYEQLWPTKSLLETLLQS